MTPSGCQPVLLRPEPVEHWPQNRCDTHGMDGPACRDCTPSRRLPGGRTAASPSCRCPGSTVLSAAARSGSANAGSATQGGQTPPHPYTHAPPCLPCTPCPYPTASDSVHV